MKMVNVLFLFVSFSLQLVAQNLPMLPSHFAKENQVFVGKEFINQHPTGHTCRIIIKSVERTSYGTHCWKINYQFDTYSGPKNIQAEVISSIMTDDTSVKKSCAQPLVDGADVSIFDLNGALLYNPLFMGNKDFGIFKGTEDYFLWFGRGNKLPVKSAFTQVKMLSENLYECENLK